MRSRPMTYGGSAGQVNGNSALPVLSRQHVNGSESGDAGIIDQDVEATECFQRSIDDSARAIPIRDVCGVGRGSTSGDNNCRKQPPRPDAGSRVPPR